MGRRSLWCTWNNSRFWCNHTHRLLYWKFSPEVRTGSSEIFLVDERKQLYDTAVKNMPVYQRPVFIRVQAEMEITGTFKVRMTKLTLD